MTETGTVAAIDKSGYATVEFERKSACGNCGMCLKTKDEMKVSIRVKNKLDAKIGDRVSVDMSSVIVLRSSFIVYIIPVVIVALALFFTRNLGELYQVIAFITSLVVSVAIDVIVDKIQRKKQKFVPTMTTVYAADKNDEEILGGDNNAEF